MSIITKFKIAVAITASIYLLASSNAIAKDAIIPQPKAYSTITGDTITVGDVFEGVKNNADFYLAPAPEVGKIRVISLNELVQISKILKLGWEPEHNLHRTVVRKSAASIQRTEIESSLKKALQQKITGNDFEIELLDKNIKIAIAEGSPKQLKVENINFDNTRMTASADIYSVTNPDDKKQVKASVHYLTKIPVLNSTLRRGEIISDSNIDYIQLRMTDIPASMISNAEHIIGKTPRNNISAMSPIYESDLRLPVLVNRGDVVIMKLNSQNISLTTQGQAVQNGKQGDLVRVENLSSKQIVTAIVTGEREVTIISPTGNNI